MESQEKKEKRNILNFGDFELHEFLHYNGAVFIGKRKIDPITAQQSTTSRVYEVRVTYSTEENGKHTAVGTMDGKPIFELTSYQGRNATRRLAVGTLYSFYENQRKRNGHKSKKGKENDNGNS